MFDARADKTKNYRDEFSNWWRREFPAPIKFEAGLVFDFYPDLKNARFVSWNHILPK